MKKNTLPISIRRSILFKPSVIDILAGEKLGDGGVLIHVGRMGGKA